MRCASIVCLLSHSILLSQWKIDISIVPRPSRVNQKTPTLFFDKKKNGSPELPFFSLWWTIKFCLSARFSSSDLPERRSGLRLLLRSFSWYILLFLLWFNYARLACALLQIRPATTTLTTASATTIFFIFISPCFLFHFMERDRSPTALAQISGCAASMR